MASELVPQAAGELAAGTGELIRMVLAESYSAATQRTYRQGLEHFAGFCGTGSVEAAAALLLASGPGPANALVLRYKAALAAAGAAPATINVRLSTLRTVVRLARTCGLIVWTLDVRGVRVQVLRDTRGPGPQRLRRMLREADRAEGPKALRDHALLRLLGDLGLRRAEALGLDLGDVEAEPRPGLWIRGKGRAERERVTLPARTWQALSAWLAVRPAGAGEALFVGLARGRRPERRLTGSGAYYVVRALGRRAGVRTRPHGLRHTAITLAVERAAEVGRPLTDVLRFSRHSPASLSLLVRYAEVAQDAQGAVADLVAEAIGGDQGGGARPPTAVARRPEPPRQQEEG